jgi:hypothetical protein
MTVQHASILPIRTGGQRGAMCALISFRFNEGGAAAVEGLRGRDSDITNWA